MLSNILERFVEESPVTVMAQSLMLKIFAPERLDHLFEEHAQHQYQQELLKSSQVDLMSTVVCGIHPSVHAAYRAKARERCVSTTTLYKKLQGIEIEVSQANVKETAADLHQLIQQMGESPPSILPGYIMRIADGTCLGSTDHRPSAIRYHAALRSTRKSDSGV